MKITAAISPCPNDTFAFSGILQKSIDMEGLEFDFEFLDIQQLNAAVAAERFDVAKASFFAALKNTTKYRLLRSGAALGSGVGPLLVAKGERGRPDPDSRILCPGADTTANLLFRVLFPAATRIEHCLFSRIMPTVRAGDADYGVVIHEGRFCYQEFGLSRVLDLGEEWEKQLGCLIPLGGILLRRSIDGATGERINRVLARSIEYAFEHKQEAYPLMRKYASELDDAAIWGHVDLYVNEYTKDLGAAGMHALAELNRIARAQELVDGEPYLEVVG